MASLSENERDAIKGQPLGNSLDDLRRPLEDTERSFSLISSLDGADESSDEWPARVSKLLLRLAGSDAAFSLSSKSNKHNITSELAYIASRTSRGGQSYAPYRPLVQLVIKQASDYDIWAAVLELITTASRETPVPAATVPHTFENTPITHSSASQQTSEQTRRLIEARVFEEIKGCTFRDVGGFYEKFFEGKTWTNRARSIYESVKDQYVDSEWVALRDSPTQDQVLSWLFRLQDDTLSTEERYYCTINSPKELVGGEARRQVDVILQKRSATTPNNEYDWKNVEVIGELKQSDTGVKATLVQVARYARDVFASQPTRRYLHAFTLCGASMTLWVFDRSGCYSPGPFDIHKEPERFIQVLAGYTMMNDDQLGLDMFTEQENGHRVIRIENEDGRLTLQLHPDPLTRQRAIVCRGTSCYLARPEGSVDWDLVTKFSWTSDKRRPETDLLRLANQRGVKGLARLIGDHSVTSIIEMRTGMTFTKSYNFRGTLSNSPSSTQLLNSSLNSLAIPDTYDGRLLKKRKSSDMRSDSAKRSRSADQRLSVAATVVTYDVKEAQGASLFTSTDNLYDNRILRCLVISPAGRPIYRYRSILELLKALRDAITAHRSLYLEGKILHRDISENNIIITDLKKTGFSGMLIDMDLAKEVGTGPSGARCRTGTMEFMAIEVLQKIDHTYRHDLESFFYVLVWQCGRHGWIYTKRLDSRPYPGRLTSWYTGDYQNIADMKQGHVDAIRFANLLDTEFPPEFECVKDLCMELRGILFPIRNGAKFTGTPADPNVLYEPIIEAFNETIEDLEQVHASGTLNLAN